VVDIIGWGTQNHKSTSDSADLSGPPANEPATEDPASEASVGRPPPGALAVAGEE